MKLNSDTVLIVFCLKHLKRGEGQELVEAGRKGYSGREYNATGSSYMQELWRWRTSVQTCQMLGISHVSVF